MVEMHKILRENKWCRGAHNHPNFPNYPKNQYQYNSKVYLVDELVGTSFAVEDAKLKSFGTRDKFYTMKIVELFNAGCIFILTSQVILE